MTDMEGYDFNQGDPHQSALVTLTPDMMKKRLVWDVSPCDMAIEVAKKIGLHPASEEVEQMEHQQSHQRLYAVAPVSPVVNMASLFAAEAIRGAMMVSHGDEIAEAQILEVERFAPVIFAATMAIIAELNDVDFIHINPSIFEAHPA